MAPRPRIFVVRKPVFAEVVGIPPIVGVVDPVGAVARLVVGAAFEAGSVEDVTLGIDPVGVVAGLVVVRFQIVDLAADAAIVAPLHRSARIGRAVVSDRIVPESLLLAELRTFEFVPLVVGQRIAVGILHHPDDTRFGRSFEGVARNREIVAAAITLRRIVDAVVEPDHDTTAESAERNHAPQGSIDGVQPPVGILQCSLRARLVSVEPDHRIVDELSRSGNIGDYPVAVRRTAFMGWPRP